MTSDIRFNSSAVRAGDSVSSGLSLISPNYVLYLGMSLVSLLIMFAVSFIPFLGGILSQIIYAPLLCGFYLALLTSMRGEQPVFSMLFEGFSRFVPAALVMLVQILPWFGIGLLMVGYMFAFDGQIFNPAADINPDNPFGVFSAQMMIVFGAIYLLALLISIAMRILFFSAIPLIADHNLGFADAVRLSFKAGINNAGGLLLLTILEILMLIAGVLLFCIGFIFVLPVIFAADIAAYRQIFPDDQLAFNNEPPRPDVYGGNYGMPQDFQ